MCIDVSVFLSLECVAQSGWFGCFDKLTASKLTASRTPHPEEVNGYPR